MSESTTEEPRVIYVPGGPEVNRYYRDENVIVLDEALKDYPDAHEIVLEHELEHARQNSNGTGVREHLVHEFQTDFLLYVSTSEKAETMREYLEGESPDRREAAREAFWTMMDVVRSLWNTFLMPAGYVYRRLHHLKNGVSDSR
jgi:hypothetical protein